jgi:hypothetical protein
MRDFLKLHPESPSFAVSNIEVVVTRPSVDDLILSYIVTGKMNEVRMPPVMPAGRADELWRHTCFEAFVRASLGAAYYEFNFAPSTQWAAYRFTGYRSGMSAANEIGSLPIEVRSSPDRYTLQASLPLNLLSALPRNSFWRLGLSAVIEDTSDHLSYWALAHPPGKPDFHHPDCFAHNFPATVKP